MSRFPWPVQNYYLSFASSRVSVISECVFKQIQLMFFSRPLYLPESVWCCGSSALHHASKLPFWQSGFGSKATETGAFRTAWAPVMSLTECQKSENACWESNLFHWKNRLWSYKPLGLFFLDEVCLSLPVIVKDDESHHRAALPRGGEKLSHPRLFRDLVISAGNLSRLLAWVFFP